SWAAGGGNVTPGSCARGSGAGSTAIQRLNGLWVNSVAMTVNNGATTYSVGALSATYVGSVFVDSTAGQVTCHVSAGQARKWGVWNAYNRRDLSLSAIENTGADGFSWSYSSSTWRQSNNNANNYAFVFSGLAEESVNIEFTELVSSMYAPPNSLPNIAIGINALTPPGRQSYAGVSNTNLDADISAQYTLPPSVGVNKIITIERENGNSVPAIFFGYPYFQMTCTWM